MGWLKRIFSGSGDGEGSEADEPVEATIDVMHLDKWVEKQANSGFEKVKPEIEEHFIALAREKKRLFAELDKLRDAELHNPNISEREKQLMQGNRESYISQHRQFANVTEFSDELTCKETSLFCKNFEELLIKLAKSSAKAHMVMDEFFAHHAAAVNRSIKAMSGIVTKIQETLSEGNLNIEELDTVRKAVHELKSKRKLLTELGQELAVFRKKLDNSKYLKKKLQKQIEQLKQTDDYLEFQEQDGKRNEHWHDLQQTEDEIGALFSALDRPMRKFERVLAEGADLLAKYIEDPMKALISDESLQILSIFDRMRKSIEAGGLELKDKEKEKALQRIGQITKEKLSEARMMHEESKKTIKQIDDHMRKSRVLQDIDEIKYKIDHTDNQIQILQDKIEKAEKTKEKIDLDALSVEVKKKIDDSLGVEVTITWQEDSQAA
jgi:hypothetical protein